MIMAREPWPKQNSLNKSPFEYNGSDFAAEDKSSIDLGPPDPGLPDPGLH